MLDFTGIDRPNDDTIEVAVFGKGVGESIALHIGDGNWILIDSFKEAGADLPVSLRYLEAMGYDFKSSVKLIIATHWHDDHIRGISTSYELCANAQLCIAGVLSTDEAQAFISRGENLGTARVSSGVGELSRLRQIQVRDNRVPFIPATASRILVRHNGEEFSHEQCVHLESLAPSDKDYQMFLEGMAEKMVGDLTVSRITEFQKNDISVPVYCSVGPVSLLLGADMEVLSDDRGWHAILNSKTRPQQKAILYKVAHHGSPNGDHDRIWEEFLTEEPIAILTPFGKGARQRPDDSDVKRILSRTPKCFQAGISKNKKYKDLRIVEKILKNNNISLRSKSHQTGLCRVRFSNLGEDFKHQIQLSGYASSLAMPGQ